MSSRRYFLCLYKNNTLTVVCLSVWGYFHRSTDAHTGQGAIHPLVASYKWLGASQLRFSELNLVPLQDQKEALKTEPSLVSPCVLPLFMSVCKHYLYSNLYLFKHFKLTYTLPFLQCWHPSPVLLTWAKEVSNKKENLAVKCLLLFQKTRLLRSQVSWEFQTFFPFLIILFFPLPLSILSVIFSVYLSVSTCMFFVSVSVCLLLSLSAYMRVPVSVCICICVHVCMHAHTFVCVCVCFWGLGIKLSSISILRNSSTTDLHHQALFLPRFGVQGA